MYVYIYIYTYIHTYIHYITLHYITFTLHYITLHYITFTLHLHYITLHYITLHYTTLHYTTLHTYIHPRRIFHRTTIMLKFVSHHSAVLFFYAEGSLKFFKNSDVSSTLTVFCVLKRVGYTHPFFPTQSFASVCPVKARRSLS